MICFFLFFHRCNYLFLFDSVYLNETLQFYTHSGWPSYFKSLSSAVFIGLCSSPQSPPDIKLQYYIEREYLPYCMCGHI